MRFLWSAFLTALLAFSGSWVAASEKIEGVPFSRELVTPGAIAQVVIGLVLVIGVIFLVAWLLKRIGGVVPNNGKLKIVAGMALGQRERVMLIQVGESKQVLLGITSQRISRLAEFDELVVSSEEGGEFAARLKGVLSAEKERK